MLRTITTIAILFGLLLGGSALASPTPQQACQAAKSKAAGKYAACRQAAEAKLVTGSDVPKYTAAITKCGTQFTTAWQKAIAKAAAAGATCPDDPLSASDFQTIIAAHSIKVANGLAGLGLHTCAAATLLKTGQTTCYDAGGALIPCAATGHDGELKKGTVRSYTDNGDGTITDNITGLMWEKLSHDGSLHEQDTLYTWDDAFTNKIAMLNTTSFAGYTDWRLPNANELHSLSNYGLNNPAVDAPFDSACAPACSVTTCSCTKPAPYWASTTYLSIPARAWTVNFAAGHLGPDIKTFTNSVRAVRDSCAAIAPTIKTGQTDCWDSAGTLLASCANTGQDGQFQTGVARSYTDNLDGTITDNNTGLMWEKLSNDATVHDKDTVYLWEDAFAVKVAMLNSSSFAGHADWRLPNINELQSLANYGAQNPAVDPLFNTACPGGCDVTACSCTKTGFAFYWSSTTAESAPSSAWGVQFSPGDIHTGSKVPGDFVRAVRGGS